MITSSTSFDFLSAALDHHITFARSGTTATVVNSSGVWRSSPDGALNPLNGGQYQGCTDTDHELNR